MPGIIPLEPDTPSPSGSGIVSASEGVKLSDITAALALVVGDPRLADFAQSWVNEAVFDIATEIDLPRLKIAEPAPVTVTTAGWLFDVPEDYHKGLFACENSTRDMLGVSMRHPQGQRFSIEDINALDSDHDETATNVDTVAICDEKRKLAVYPKANDTLYLWFFEKPENLDSENSRLVCIPRPYVWKVLIPKLVIRNFEVLVDMMVDMSDRPLLYWERKYREGLYGSEGGDIGMLNYFAKQKGKPRRHGGRDSLP